MGDDVLRGDIRHLRVRNCNFLIVQCIHNTRKSVSLKQLSSNEFSSWLKWEWSENHIQQRMQQGAMHGSAILVRDV